MAKTLEFHKRRIKSALKMAGNNMKSLEMQVEALASAMRTMEMANEQISTLTEVTVLEETRYGSKYAPHPAFKVLKDAQDSITRQMKILGLTAEDLAGGIEDDPLVDLTERVIKTGKKVVVKPKGE